MANNFDELSESIYKLHKDVLFLKTRFDRVNMGMKANDPTRAYHELLELRKALEEIPINIETIANAVKQLNSTLYVFEERVQQLIEARNAAYIASTNGLLNAKDRNELRNWWHEILRNHGRYSCFAVLLILPADKEAIRYLTEFSRELHLISGEKCLVLGMGKTELRYFGFDERLWKISIEEQVLEGYSLKVAQLFNIALSDFPCLILFRDIRSPEHLAVSLKAMKAEEIAEQIRALFSIVNKASADNEDPLTTIEHQRNNERFRKAGGSIISELRHFAGKSFETALEATINAIIK